MAHKMLRSEFLGKTLERGSQLKGNAKLPAKQKTQALFGGPKRTQKSASRGAQDAANKAKQALGGLGKQAQRQTRKAPSPPRPQNLQRAVQQAPKKAQGAAKGAAKGARSRGGWFGSGSGGASQSLSKYYGPNRDLFLPGGLLEREDVPPWLNGTLAGDYGYDPLGLGKNPDSLRRFQIGEVFNGRIAMLAAAGIIIPEGLQANGADIRGGTWFETGAEMLDGGTLNYFAVPWAVIPNPLPLFVVLAIEVVLVGAAENFRGKGEGPGGYAPGVGRFESDIFQRLDNLYPGGPFDPLNLADDPEVFEELKVKEIKNGRLAKTAFLGFMAQAYVTGEGPYANFTKHLSDPFGYNLLTILGNEDRIPTL